MEKEVKEELKKMLQEMSDDIANKGKYNTGDLTKNTAENLIKTIEILHAMNNGATIMEATTKFIRAYEEAYGMCLKNGAEDNDEFKYDFTTYYINAILSLVANLISIKDFAKNDRNRAFLKSKIRECLIYIDML